MPENHTATAILVAAVLFAVVGVAQLVRGAALIVRARRATTRDPFDERPDADRARGVRVRRTGVVCFACAVVALVLVEVSLH